MDTCLDEIDTDWSAWRGRWPDPPAPAKVRRVRLAAGITQERAAELLYCRVRRWQSWEYGEATMHPALWELFLRKLAEIQAQPLPLNPHSKAEK